MNHDFRKQALVSRYLVSTARLLLVLLLLALCTPQRSVNAATEDGFAEPSFQRLWIRTDQLVAAGGAGRSWMWGERAGDRRYERFDETTGGARLVQYFDKGRMEITNPAGNRSSPWFVTGGRLVVELITGQVQVGAQAFEQRAPAGVPIAGDPHDNPDAPTYGMLRAITSFDGSQRAPSRIGARVSATYGPAGIGSRADLALAPTQIVRYETTTGHNIPKVFRDFMEASGPVIENGRIRRARIVDSLFVFGHPITEPYWADVRIGGVVVPVLFQAFERRLLTYTPSNPDPWKVEMGNVGQHYVRWRYGRPIRYAQPSFPGGVRVREITLTIPTYGYEQALVPTAPGDPIYPYQRLAPSLVGPPQPRTYRAIIVENRFLELTFLPELGGRLYRAVDKGTGHNIFYQNPVVKPSAFGQRGWWLGVGGLEWAAPTEEHGYLENLPWDLVLLPHERGVNVRASTTEQQSGMRVAGLVELKSDEGRFHVRMEVSNPTSVAHPLQMWTNAALSPGGSNTIGPGLHFVVPSDRMIVHATQDSQLPGPRAWIEWPYSGGRDLSRPIHWNGYLGAFAPWPVSFIGAYDTAADEGAAVVHQPTTIGAKMFGFSRDFDKTIYTDDASEYVELWSGAQPTFWDYPALDPGATRAIDSDWLPLWGLGDLMAASSEGALGLVSRADGGLTVSIASAQIIRNDVVIVRIDGREVFRTAPLDLRPDQPLSIDLPPSASTGRGVQVEISGLVLETAR